jgi:hypothetical protein
MGAKASWSLIGCVVNFRLPYAGFDLPVDNASLCRLGLPKS